MEARRGRPVVAFASWVDVGRTVGITRVTRQAARKSWGIVTRQGATSDGSAGAGKACV